MSQSKIKKQHYVPRSYLRLFSEIHDNNMKHNDKKNKVFVYDKENMKFFNTNVYDSACVNYFYNIDSASSDKDKQVFETAFSNMENESIKLVRRIISICSIKENLNKARVINQNERDELSFYIALQLLRTEKYRENLEAQTNKFLERLKYFVDRYHEIQKKPSTCSTDLKINAKTFHLSFLSDFDYISEIASFISNSCWVLYNNKTDTQYVTSDNPVCRIPRTVDSNKYVVDSNGTILSKKELTLTGFFSQYLELLFPLSPNICLHIMQQEIPSYNKLKKYRNKCVAVNDKKMVNEHNKMQFMMANKRVYTCPQNQSILQELSTMNFPSVKTIL